MARLSKVDRLPAEIREAIAALRRDGRTIDEILAHIREMGVGPEAVGRTGLGEHIKDLDELAKLARQDRAMAEVLVKRDLDEDDGQVARANIEMMHGLLFRMSIDARSGSEFSAGPKEIKLMSEVLRNLATAEKANLDRVIRLKKHLAEKAREAVEKIAKDVAAAKGPIDPMELIRRVREDIYGIYDE